MTAKDIMEKLSLKLIAGGEGLSRKPGGVYVCDLLSWVMAHAKAGDIWVTIQTHPNVVAVASLLELSCIVIPDSAEVGKDTIEKANEEGIPLLSSCENGYRICCRLNELMGGK